MIVQSLKLTNFRNIVDSELCFSNDVNLLYGDNAQGKTNIVEAIGFLSTLRSFRSDDNNSLVMNDKEFAIIEGKILKNGISHTLKSVVTKTGSKNFLNKQEVKKNGDFIGLLNVVTFSPVDVGLFKEAPKERREFMDEELSKLSPSYYQAKIKCQKLLRERNEILKAPNINKDLIEVITSQIARTSYEILTKRRSLIAKLSILVDEKYGQLVNESAKIDIKYLTQLEQCKDAKQIYDLMMNNYDDDVNKKATQIGIHRDDMEVSLNYHPIGSYGSQGQNRLAAIALKLSSIEVIKQTSGEQAVVVLDDVLSELDEDKQKRLVNDLQIDNQLFITTTQNYQLEDFNKKKIAKFLIKQGMIGGKENG